MKKQIHFTLLFILSVFIAQAQVTLTSAGINPVDGETFSYLKGGYVNAGSSGANQTWTIPGFLSTSSNNVVVNNPGSSIIGASFPNANIAWSNTTTNDAYFFKTTSAVLQLEGKFENTWLMPYSNPEELIRFPFTHLDSFSDAWANQYQKNSYTFYQKGNTKVKADGYGTLTTPTGSYNNVMRIRYDRTDKDSTYQNNIPMVTFDTIVEYKWYQNGIHCPIASAYTMKNSLSGTTYGCTYLLNFVGLNEYQNSISNYSIFPNPVKNNLNISFDVKSDFNAQIKIYNTIGALVKEQAFDNLQTGMNNIAIGIAELSNGVYFVQLKSGNAIETKRFVVSK